jgi:hypothetical protein
MSDQNVFKATTKATMPWETAYTVTHSLIVDSRQRDCSRYKTPSAYKVNIGDTFKNITSIELKGAIIPKASYNVHSGNNKIDFAIGDFVTGFYIINGGGGYTSAPNVSITSPMSGVTATASAIINSQGKISNIVLGIAGSGYSPSKPPFIFIDPPQNRKQAIQPQVLVIIGNHYTATLRVGEYDIGGNPIPPATLPSNLLLEIQNAMNYAVNGGMYNPLSTSPFAVRVVSQYPMLGATPGTPEAFDTNACLFNRIQVTNVNSDVWEFLWYSGPNHENNSASILGFNTVDSGTGIITLPVVTGAGTLIPGGTSIRGPFEYNLKNDPDYVILSIYLSDKNMDRLTSLDDGIDDKFAVLLFDNNNPETLHDLSSAPGSSVTNIGGVRYLEGQTGKGVFWRDAGAIKPMKGTDYDSKKLSFRPPIGKVSSITVMFTKFGYKPGGTPQFYNMEGREHLLMFELSATDQRSQMKD